MRSDVGSAAERAATARGVLILVAAGLALGLGYNWFGLESRRPWGLSWIGADPVAGLASMEAISADGAPAADGGYVTSSSDPLAVGLGGAPRGLPPIPAVGRPVEMKLSAVRQYVEAGAALILDAREAWEYEESHIPGARSVPYERAVSDPMLLESLGDPATPVITYCGGGGCELSIGLANELLFFGYERVAVFMDGFPTWVEAGLPTESGAGDS